MKYKITNEKIELDYFLLEKFLVYKKVVLNNEYFKCVYSGGSDFDFTSNKINPDFNRWITLSPKITKPWYGIIAYLISCLFWSASFIGDVYGFDIIGKFLTEAKEKGYNVEGALNEYILSKQKHDGLLLKGETNPWHNPENKKTVRRVINLIIIGIFFLIVATFLLFRFL